MSIPLTINGATFEYPQNFDENWGIAATGWAQAVTNGMLQRAGGNFPLLADANFGTSFGLIAEYLTSQSANPATVGTIRLASADPGVAFRNNANTGNLVLTTDGSDNLLYNGHILSLAAAGTVTSITGTANQVIASASTGNITLSLPQSLAPASTPTFTQLTLTTSTSLFLGVSGSHTGSIVFNNLSNSNFVKLNTGATSADYTFQLPINTGSSGQVLQTDGTGATSWVNATGTGTVNSGITPNIAYYATSSNVISDSGISRANLFLADGSVAATGAFNLNSNKITSLAAPTTTGDALVYGDGFSVGGNKITNLANGTVSTDAAAFGQIPVFKAPTIQRLTSSSGTYTLPTSPSPLYLRIKMVGGGGGGSGGGTSTPGAGSNGTASTFGTTFLSAGFGAGGAASPSDGGAGGSNLTGGTGIINQQGGQGAGSQTTPSSAAGISGGIGGCTALSGGARGNHATQIASTNGVTGQSGTGEGGQGGAVDGANGNSGTGGGGGGYLDVVVTSPSSTYAYTVGTGGNGGSAGSNGGTGGTGASGIIIVEEYYQ